MIYTYENTDKTIGINSKQTFVDALGKDEILNLKSFDEIFQKSENLVKKEYPGVTGGALSNVRGNWYEWLLAIGVLEFRRAYPNAHHLIPLPNIKQYDCARLYQTKIFQYIQDLRKKVSESADVSLITSNPDFV
ncbi:MAG: Cfr10I/Bse634I family restriction endonuclease, partial [Alphaproteobacteria bacterium]|nr:Cfr10I/Bse634I family restriction endonuclease [Alphaproteobacteria bacterium]